MPLPLDEAMSASADAAALKAAQARRPWRYLTSSALAGAYVGVAVVLLVTVSAPFAAAGSPGTRLVQAAVFGLALVLVVFAGSELFTGNVMAMAHGLATRAVAPGPALRVLGLSLVGNLVGSVLLAAVVVAGGTLELGGDPPPGRALVASTLAAKGAASGPELFWRAVLCNALVCLGLWMALRAQGDGAKLAVLWWALFAFIGAGFEHSVANMTLFSLGALLDVGTWGDLAANLVWTLPGNIVGGGLVVGGVYGWLAGRPAGAVAAGRPPQDGERPRVVLSRTAR